MGAESKILDYPVFAICYADGYLVASGGGGGQTYGIRNKLEVYRLRSKFRSEELHLESETTEQDGIIDSLDYNQKVKMWIGSLDDSTILFSYKPNFGIKILGKFKTDYITKDPKQNVCKFGHESTYFATGGNECCVRLWRLTDKLIKDVKDFQQVTQINKKSGKSNNKYKKNKRKQVKMKDEEKTNGSGDEDETSSIEEMLVDQKKLLHTDVLISREESSSDDQSSIDDTSASPSLASSPILSPSGVGVIDHEANLVVKDKELKPIMTYGDNLLNTGNKQGKKNKQKNDILCKMILEYRDHLKPINDCCILNELLVSTSNDCMIFYRIIPMSKLLLKHKDDKVLFKFVKILADPPKKISQNQNSQHSYTMLTLECYNTSVNYSGDNGEKLGTATKNKTKVKDGTKVTLWSFNIMTKKLTELKSSNISNQKSSSLTLDSTETRFAVGFGDGSVSVYSVENLKLVKRIRNHKLPVTDMTFASTQKLLSSGIDYYVYINEMKKFNFKYYWLLFSIFLLIVSIVAGRYSNII